MWRLLLKFAIYIAMKDKSKFLRFLAKIEYGVAIFCFKLQRLAQSEGHFNLASMLENHGKEEKKHGKMLASLADGCDRIYLSELGQWVSITRPSGENLINRPVKADIAKTLIWDSIVFPGEKLIGLFENFDGISKRYFSAKILFDNKAAADYPWEDKLAFMYALEEETAAFYQMMVEAEDAILSAIALQITGDELNHANYLKLALSGFAPIPQAAIDKWRSRVWWAKWGLIVDAIRLLTRR